jgi:hypothetical protein
MAEPLENLAHRLENDPFFLACPLMLFARSADLAEEQLAEKLGCSMETLVLVRLCRAPSAEPGKFQKDIMRIASSYQVDADALTQAVRQGQAIYCMRAGPKAKTLMAARDGDQDQEYSQGGGA